MSYTNSISGGVIKEIMLSRNEIVANKTSSGCKKAATSWGSSLAVIPLAVIAIGEGIVRTIGALFLFIIGEAVSLCGSTKVKEFYTKYFSKSLESTAKALQRAVATLFLSPRYNTPLPTYQNEKTKGKAKPSKATAPKKKEKSHHSRRKAPSSDASSSAPRRRHRSAGEPIGFDTNGSDCFANAASQLFLNHMLVQGDLPEPLDEGLIRNTLEELNTAQELLAPTPPTAQNVKRAKNLLVILAGSREERSAIEGMDIEELHQYIGQKSRNLESEISVSESKLTVLQTARNYLKTSPPCEDAIAFARHILNCGNDVDIREYINDQMQLLRTNALLNVARDFRGTAQSTSLEQVRNYTNQAGDHQDCPAQFLRSLAQCRDLIDGGCIGVESSAAEQISISVLNPDNSDNTQKFIANNWFQAPRTTFIIENPVDISDVERRGPNPLELEHQNVIATLQLSDDVPTSIPCTLTGLVVHKGRRVTSGHYIALIKQNDGTWWKCDDGRISKLRGFREVQQIASKNQIKLYSFQREAPATT